MTPSDKQQAILQVIAAKLEDARARQGLYKARLAQRSHLSERTIWAVFKGHDHYVSTLNEVADAMGCELVIELRKR